MHVPTLFTNIFKQTVAQLRRFPKKYTIGGSVAATIVIVPAILFWPRAIAHSRIERWVTKWRRHGTVAEDLA